MAPLTPEQHRLLAAARKAEDAHLNRAKSAVVQQLKGVTLTRAEQALKAALSVPASKREASIRAVLSSISEATQGTRTPPAAVLGVMRRAVADRVLNAQDLALLTDPKLLFGDSTELQAKAVARQRKEMNGYWTGETTRFRNDVAATVREAIRGGLDPEKAADLLQERLGVHRSRAVLIAVDQVLTATARAEQSQLRAAGLKAFQWRTVGDNRVRSAHARLEGRVFTWRGAPELPGAAIRCRCRAMVPDAQAVPDIDPIRVPDALFALGQPQAVRETMLEARRVATESGYTVQVNARVFGGNVDSPAGFNRASGIIFLNPKSPYWADAQAFMTAVGPTGTGYLSSSHPMHVIHHEIAHGEHLKQAPVQYKDADRGWTLATQGAYEVSGVVSIRAKADPREFVAEVFAGRKAGQVYTEDVMRWYHALGGPQ